MSESDTEEILSAELGIPYSALKKQKISVKIESDFLLNAVCRENQGSIFTFF